MFDHAPSTPQLKPDTYATFDLRYVTESAEIGVYNVKDVNRKTTFSSGVQEWESVKMSWVKFMHARKIDVNTLLLLLLLLSEKSLNAL